MRFTTSSLRFQLHSFLRGSFVLCALLFAFLVPAISVTCIAQSKPSAVGSTTTMTASSSTIALAITTTSCPAGTQNAAYVGCTIGATGGTPPYTFSVDSNGKYPPLPEGMSINASTGKITASVIGGQGKYIPEIIVTDSAGAQATAQVLFEINGHSGFLAKVFPSNSIFHHRVDAATTGLPVDTSPAAAIYSAYLNEPIDPLFGNKGGGSFPWGIPAIEVPYNQPDVEVATTVYSDLFTSGPIPPYAPVEGTKYSAGDRHVLVYLEPGPSTNPTKSGSLRDVGRDLRGWSLDRFVKRALGQCEWQCAAARGPGNLRRRRAAGRPTAGERRRSNRNRHAHRAQRSGEASDTIHAQPHGQLLGVARDAHVWSGIVQDLGRNFDSRDDRDFPVHAARHLQLERTGWRDLQAEGFGGIAGMRGHQSASRRHHHRDAQLRHHPGR